MLISSSLRLLALMACSFLVMNGCCRPSHYVAPSVDLCDGWKNDNGQGTLYQSAQFAWWKIFDDPYLSALQQCAMEGSPDIKAALARFDQAYARYEQSFSPLLPKIIMDPTFHNEGRVPPSFLTFTSIPGFTFPQRIIDRLYRFPFAGSYELDIWGKNCSRNRAASAMAEVAYYQWVQALLLLGGQVADLYYAAASLQQQIELLSSLAEVREKMVAIYRTSFEKGLLPMNQLLDAEILLQGTLQQKFDLERQKTLAVDLLAALLGTTVCCFDIQTPWLDKPPPMPPVALPGLIVSIRPDVAAAERQLAASFELTQAAMADRYPSLVLSGELGWANPVVNELFKWKSRLWSYTYELTQTLFDAGYKAAVVEEEAALYRERAALFEQTVLTALREVEDALAAIKSYAKQTAVVRQSLALAQQSSALAQQRFNKGFAAAIEDLQGREQLLLRQIDYAVAQGEWYRSVARLLVTLGGLWECDEEHNIAVDTTTDISPG